MDLNILQNFFWAAAAGGLTAAVIRWVTRLNRLWIYLVVGSVAGIAALAMAQRWALSVPSWDRWREAAVDLNILQNFFWAAAAGGLTGAIIRWVNGFNRPAVAGPKFRLWIYLAVGSVAGIAALAMAQRWELSAPSWDWVLVATLGALVGIGELASRYRDEPLKALLSFAAIVYVLLNAGAATIALTLGRAFIWKDVHASPVDWAQVLTAGLGAMVLLRSSVFRIKVGDQNVDIGPSSFLQSFIDAADRSVDRARAQEPAWTVATLMASVDSAKVLSLLPSFLPALMQNLKDGDQTNFNNKVAEIDHENNVDVRALRLGLLVMNYTGQGVLRAALTSLHKQIALPAENTAQAAEQAQKAAADLKAKAEENKAAVDAAVRTASQTPGTPTEVTEAAQKLAEKATSIEATAAEVSDKAKETTHQAELTKSLATGATGHELTSDRAAAEAEGASSAGVVSDRQAARRRLLTTLEHELPASRPTLSRLHAMNLKIGVLYRLAGLGKQRLR